jgi:tetratricopeptide (TPR) repeat protein
VGLVHFQNENNQVARALTEQSMLEFQQLQDAYWEARAYDIYGRSLTALGELQPSERIMRKYELARKAGERNHLADALFMISIWHYTYNRFDEAQKYAAEADLLWKQTGVQVNSSSMTFALIAWSNGDYERAKVLYAGMRDRFGWQGERYMRSGMVACLGKLAMEEGDLVQAQIYLEQALATVRELDVKSSTVFRNFDLGILFLAQGDLGRFKQAMMDGLSLRNHLDDYARFNTLTTFLESRAIQSHPVSIQLLGALHAFETQNERPFRIMQKVFLLDQALLRAREKFGDAMFESAFAEGQNMSLGESLDLVLKTVDEM